MMTDLTYLSVKLIREWSQPLIDPLLKNKFEQMYVALTEILEETRGIIAALDADPDALGLAYFDGVKESFDCELHFQSNENIHNRTNSSTTQTWCLAKMGFMIRFDGPNLRDWSWK